MKEIEVKLLICDLLHTPTGIGLELMESLGFCARMYVQQSYIRADKIEGSLRLAGVEKPSDWEIGEARVRHVIWQGVDGYRFAVKSAPSHDGLVRDEIDVKTSPAIYAEVFPEMCRSTILKVRYRTRFAGETIVVDRFAGPRRGLITAEAEFKDVESAERWRKAASALGKDITSDTAYKNKNLGCPITADHLTGIYDLVYDDAKDIPSFA